MPTSVRPHPPPTAAPSPRPVTNAPSTQTARPASTPVQVKPTPPPSAPSRAAPRKRSTNDPRSRTYTTGQHGDEDAIVLKMGQKDMALEEDLPPAGAAPSSTDMRGLEAGNQSTASSDFGSVEFQPKGDRVIDKTEVYHNIRQGEDIWNSVDLYRYNSTFETDQIHPVCIHDLCAVWR